MPRRAPKHNPQAHIAPTAIYYAIPPPPEPGDAPRGANARGYTYRWQKESKRLLAREPLCRECSKMNRYSPATEVDHIVPHKGNAALFWDRANWQPLCHSCHSIKTGRERRMASRMREKQVR